jgi:hypothetical protein
VNTTTATKTRTPRAACAANLCKNKARVGKSLCGKCQEHVEAIATRAAAHAAVTEALDKAAETGEAMVAMPLATVLAMTPRPRPDVADAMGATEPEERRNPARRPGTVGDVMAHAVVEGLRAEAATEGRPVTVKIDGAPVRLRYTRPDGAAKWNGHGRWTLEANGRVIELHDGAWTLDGTALDLRKTARLSDAVRLAL